MPQTFQVLRCYKCEVFQVHPTKKAPKWECKLCGEKQSIKRFYGLGTGKECRLHVQKLNEIRGEIDSTHGTTNDESKISGSPDHTQEDKVQVCTTTNKSKWLDYIDSTSKENHNTSDETMHLNDTEVVLELPKKRRKKYISVRSKTSVTADNFENEALPKKTPTRIVHDYAKDIVSSSMESNNVDISTSTTITKPAHKVISKKYVPPPIANNSRWAQFVDETQNCNVENESDPIIPLDAHNSVGSVFPFLEDEDIDSVLAL